MLIINNTNIFLAQKASLAYFVLHEQIYILPILYYDRWGTNRTMLIFFALNEGKNFIPLKYLSSPTTRREITERRGIRSHCQIARQREMVTKHFSSCSWNFPQSVMFLWNPAESDFALVLGCAVIDARPIVYWPWTVVRARGMVAQEGRR